MTLVITTKVDVTDKNLTNVVNVTSDTYDPNMTNNVAENTTVILPEADLEVTKVVSNASAHKGDWVTWTITVTNNGPDKAVNVVLTDAIPYELIFNGAVGDVVG